VDTSYHGPSHTFKGPGQVAGSLTDKRCVGEVSLRFQLDLNKEGFQVSPTRKNLKD